MKISSLYKKKSFNNVPFASWINKIKAIGLIPKIYDLHIYC